MAPPAFDRAVAYGLYSDRMRAAIHALKYDKMHPAARQLGAMLAQAIAQLAGQAPDAMLVIPMPLHRSRHNERGFNQAHLLATYALHTLHTTHPAWTLKLAPNALVRVHRTESQAQLTPRQRRMNVRGAFAVSDPAVVRGRHILLIDDVLTSGATARAAAQALQRAGAASIWVVTLARARRVFAEAHRQGIPSFVSSQANASFVPPGSMRDDALQRTRKHSSEVQSFPSRGQRDVAG